MMMGDTPNKFDVRKAVHRQIMGIVDDDIQDIFAGHSYSLEPLLMQLIREVRAVQYLIERPLIVHDPEEIGGDVSCS